MIPMPAKKKSKRSFGKGGKKPTINNPDTHHGTYDLPNASVRSYSEKAKPMKFAEGGSTTFAEEFKKARAKGAGTVFDWKGQKIAAYRAGEEPESWKKGKEEPKKEEPKKEAPKSESKPAPKSESKPASPRPTTQAETNRTIAETALANARRMTQRREEAAMTPEQKYQRTVGENIAAYGRRQQAASSPNAETARLFSKLAAEGGPMAEYYREQAKKFAGETFAKGGTVESKSMMKKEIGFMKKKGAPKSMIKHEEAEAKGMKRGGMACGGMKKYAAGGGVAPSGVRPGSPSASRINRGPTGSVTVSPAKYARGGGVESHGKTKGTMVKMASGGSVSARADGIASKGKTNCKIC